MNNLLEKYILYSEAEQNVLPLGFSCGSNCVFCSHKNIGAGSYLYEFTRYSRSADEIIEHVGFLDPGKRVAIGDSATKIFEGEPFLNKDLVRVLRAVRTRVKKAPIVITTSGALIGMDFFEALDDLAPVYVNFSLNSYDRDVLKAIAPGLQAGKVFENFEKLCAAKESVKVCASLMAVNGRLTNAEGIARDVARMRLIEGLEMIRIFLPRFSDKSFGFFFRDMDEYRSYVREIISMAGSFSGPGTPVMAEPVAPESAEVSVFRVIPGSRAALGGAAPGDRILSVNGKIPVTRSHAHSMIVKSRERVDIRIESGKNLVYENFDGTTEGAGGIVFESDISHNAYESLKNINKKLTDEGRSAVMATTGLSTDYIGAFLAKHGFSSLNPFPVTNRSFGGNIDCAGLLSFRDIANAINEKHSKASSLKNRESALIIPGAMLDHLEIDIAGTSLFDFTEETGYEVYVR